jgi:hypothetical protein
MVDPKVPWALNIYKMRIRFGDSALGKLDHQASGVMAFCITTIDGSDKAK